MNSLTQCSFCTLKVIQNKAKADNMIVTVLHDAEWGMGGVNVYMHPKGICVSSLPGGDQGERKKFWKAWLMTIGEACAC